MKKNYHVGLDVGSTTVKMAVLDKNNNIVFSKYQRHYSDIRKTIFELMDETCDKFYQEECHRYDYRLRWFAGFTVVGP